MSGAAVIAGALATTASCRERAPATDGVPTARGNADVPGHGNGAVRVVYPAAPGSFVELVDALAPSVVHVAASAPVTGGPDELVPGGGSGTALGTGFIVDRDGYVLTNDHLVTRAGKLRVVLADGSAHDAQVAGRDPKLDLALLKIEPPPTLLPARLGSSDGLRVGEWVVALGNPYGSEVTAAAGIVSALGRTDRDPVVGEPTAFRSFLRVDIRVDAAQSGGPIANMAGEVVGVATSLDGDRGQAGFAIPIERAAQVLPMLKKDGVVTRSFIGVYIHPLDAERAKQLTGGRGALVTDLVPGGPGADAGLRVGDVIVELDGRPVDHRSLPWLAATAPVGQRLALTIHRDGTQRTLFLVPEKMPD
jgi:serine protease Do